MCTAHSMQVLSFCRLTRGCCWHCFASSPYRRNRRTRVFLLTSILHTFTGWTLLSVAKLYIMTIIINRGMLLSAAHDDACILLTGGKCFHFVDSPEDVVDIVLPRPHITVIVELVYSCSPQCFIPITGWTVLSVDQTVHYDYHNRSRDVGVCCSWFMCVLLTQTVSVFILLTHQKMLLTLFCLVPISA